MDGVGLTFLKFCIMTQLLLARGHSGWLDWGGALLRRALGKCQLLQRVHLLGKDTLAV